MPAKKALRSTKKVVDEKEKKLCFVIMPFGGWFDTYYREIYCPAVEQAGLEIHRADDLYGPNNIVNDIWGYTQKSDIILADLTGKNPNVFYELGLAHAISKPVILITETEEDIPFDLRAIRILKYDKNIPDWGDKLKLAIEKSIKEILKNPKISVPATFLKEAAGSENLTVTKSDKEMIEIRQEIELLRRDFHMARRGDHPDIIGPERALEMIKEEIERGAPDDYIVRRISKYGPPTSWIRNKLSELRNQRTLL